jgi:hypothetical protein
LGLTTGAISQTQSECTITLNVLTIRNPFGSSGIWNPGDSDISFVVSSNGYNPSSARDAGKFIVSTYVTLSGSDYKIDETEFTNIFTPDISSYTG